MSELFLLMKWRQDVHILYVYVYKTLFFNGKIKS